MRTLNTKRRTTWPLIILTIAALSLLPTPGPVAAQGADQSITVTANTVNYVFGQRVTFHLEATSPSPITNAVIAYRTADNQGTSVFPLSFDPAPQVSLDHVHEISRGYLKPFVTIEYWWTLENEAGQQVNTPLQRFTYEDNRFGWHTASSPNAIVHWYAGDATYAQAALDIATRSLARRAEHPVDRRAPRRGVYPVHAPHHPPRNHPHPAAPRHWRSHSPRATLVERGTGHV